MNCHQSPTTKHQPPPTNYQPSTATATHYPPTINHQPLPTTHPPPTKRPAGRPGARAPAFARRALGSRRTRSGAGARRRGACRPMGRLSMATWILNLKISSGDIPDSMRCSFSARTTPHPSQNLVGPWWNPRPGPPRSLAGLRPNGKTSHTNGGNSLMFLRQSPTFKGIVGVQVQMFTLGMVDAVTCEAARLVSSLGKPTNALVPSMVCFLACENQRPGFLCLPLGGIVQIGQFHPWVLGKTVPATCPDFLC